MRRRKCLTHSYIRDLVYLEAARRVGTPAWWRIVVAKQEPYIVVRDTLRIVLESEV